MKVQRALPQPTKAGYALLLALVFIGISLFLLASTLRWTSGSTQVTDRNNAYNRTVGAAEAATEVVLSRVTRDFVHQNFDPANLGAYRSLIPTNDWAADYEFSDGAGGVNQTWVYSSPTRVFTILDSPFSGLYGQVYACNVRANAKLRSTLYPNLAAGVRQNFQLASIPVFQFAILYGVDMEINPDYDMTVTGKVYGNANIYTSPGYRLEFQDSVAAVGTNYFNRHPDDPNPPSGFLPIYDSFHEEKVSSLTLPIGTNNSPDDVRNALLDPPPPGEDPASLAGQQRYYNKADLVVTDDKSGNVTINTGAWHNFAVVLPDVTNEATSATSYSFVTDVSFYDYRERKQVLCTEIDVGKFNAWMGTNTAAAWLISLRGRALNSIYVDDQRTNTPGVLTAVRVTDGQVLPPKGLTIATRRPLYVKGNFNLNNNDPAPGLTDTTYTQPASLVGDSITILSARWDDDQYLSNTTLGTRDAVNTTVNAAILAGIVPTTNVAGVKQYSGGVENFPRFLENWWGAENYTTFTFNGSLVALFPSRYATGFWGNPGTYYTPPKRDWFFDVNFLDWNKLPPGTPQVQKLIRGQWKAIAANSPN